MIVVEAATPSCPSTATQHQTPLLGHLVSFTLDFVGE
jgi:hypothetical protein